MVALDPIYQNLPREYNCSNCNKTINSLSEAYYVNDSSTIYANAISDQNTSHAKLTLGIGATLEDGLNISFMVDHYRNDNDAFNTSLTANIRKEF